MENDHRQFEFRIDGMDCAEEVTALKREVGRVVGGDDRLSFDILAGKMSVTSSENAVPDVLKAVARTGMRAEVWQRQSRAADDFRRPRSPFLLTWASGLATAAGFFLHVWLSGGVMEALASDAAEAAPRAAVLVYAAAIICGVWYVLPKAWHALCRLRPDMNLLMTVAVVGATIIGEWFEAATVAFLFALALQLESWSVGRARNAISALMDLSPRTARVRRNDGVEEEVAADRVAVGDVFVVRPGERVPVDGRVIEGASHVDQAPITGECRPVEKEPGTDVFAGTINGDGVLTAECMSAADDTTLAHIIRMVGEAQSQRAPSEQWVEKFARVYTPAVMGLALLVLLAPPLLAGGSWSVWFYNALVLLVIACPCALVISTPVSIVAALASAARQGVLIKGGVYVESPARLKAIALDKTGTLTKGEPTVVEVVPLNGHTNGDLLERASAMEQFANHPLARAIVEYAGAHGIQPAPAEGFQVIQGRGAVAQFDGREFWLGSHRYLEERNQETPEIHARLEEMSGAGRTVVVVGNDEHVCGLIALADTVRPEARQTVEALRRSGIEHVIMLTGDNAPTARAIAGETGVDEVRAELLPADKVSAVEDLVSRYDRVAMVGDGVNDAPALGRATLGIAMGAAGSDAAIETADVALMSDDLTRLPWLIRHSRRTLRIIRQNIGVSLAIKALFVVLTLAGSASLWAAIAADMGASLLVVFNGLRLLRPSLRIRYDERV